MGFDMSGYHTVLSFKIKHIRHGQLLFEGFNRGGGFSDENKKKLGQIAVGDSRFEQIYARIPGEDKPRRLNDIHLEIKAYRPTK